MANFGCRALVLILALTNAACASSPAGPSAAHPALTQVSTTAHYIVRTAPGDSVDTVWQEQYYDWVVGALELQPSPLLEYHKYRDRAHLKALTGKETNGFAEPRTTKFHTIWPTDNHEGVHTLVLLQIGHPPALFNEGVAVAHHMDPARSVFTARWNGTDVHALARQFDAAGQLPALTAILGSTGFFSFDPNVTYPCAGSFVRYLLDTYGLAKFKTYVRSATFDDSPGTTTSRFLSAYGRTVESVWDEWRIAIR